MKTVLHTTWPAWAGVGDGSVSKSWGPGGGHLGHGCGFARSEGHLPRFTSLGPDGEVASGWIPT